MTSQGQLACATTGYACFLQYMGGGNAIPPTGATKTIYDGNTMVVLSYMYYFVSKDFHQTLQGMIEARGHADVIAAYPKYFTVELVPSWCDEHADVYKIPHEFAVYNWICN